MRAGKHPAALRHPTLLSLARIPPCAHSRLTRLAALLPRPPQKNRDKYGRVVGICSLAKAGSEREDLNAWMVQQGLAVAYRCAAILLGCAVLHAAAA